MFNQNIISNKFDLNLSTTLSSYWCTAIFTKSCSLHYVLKKPEETKIQKVKQTTLKKGTTTSKSNANETRGKKWNKLQQRTRNHHFQIRCQWEKEAKVKTTFITDANKKEAKWHKKLKGTQKVSSSTSKTRISTSQKAAQENNACRSSHITTKSTIYK